MTLDTVPWAIGGNGVVHSAEIARALAAAVTGSKSGVVRPNDMIVRPKVTPGAAVRAGSGLAVIANSYAGQVGQSYVVRNSSDEEISIPATTAAARSDLLILRIDDPNYGGSQPPNVATGPYVRFALISNVGSTATDVAGLSYPYIPLSRIDIPANTATITAAMIVDVRKSINGVRGRGTSPAYASGATYANGSQGNIAGPWTPSVAQRAGSTTARVKGVISASAAGNQDADHRLQAQLNGGAWFDIDSAYQPNAGQPTVPLSGFLVGQVDFEPADALALRIVTNVAGGGSAVRVGGASISATFS